MSSKVRSLYLIFFFLFVVHAAEEYLTNFYNIDRIIIFLSNHFLASTLVVFVIIQFFWLGFLLSLYLLAKKRKFGYWILLLVGLIFLAELSHVIPAIINHDYYPGLYSSILIVLFGIYYWRILLTIRS